MVNVFTMDEIGREFAIAEKAYDIAMAEVAFMESMIDSRLKINKAKSELKVMTESTEDTCTGDLAYLFNEAAKDAEASGEGIFAKVKNAVVNFFVSTWNTIQKIFTKKDTETYKRLKGSKSVIKLPMNAKFFANVGDAVCGSAADGKTTGEKVGAVAKILGITTAAGVGLIGTVKLIKDKLQKEATTETELTEDEALTVMEKLQNIFGKFIQPIKNFKDSDDKEEPGFAAKLLNLFGDFGKYIKSAIDKIRTTLKIGVNETHDAPKAPDEAFAEGVVDKIKDGLTGKNKIKVEEPDLDDPDDNPAKDTSHKK